MRKVFSLNRLYLLLSVLILAGGLGWSQLRADAGPARPQAADRVAAISADGKIVKSVLLPDAAYTMVNTTPVNGTVACVQGDTKQWAAQLTFSGTMAGTAPTFVMVLQHSIDYDPANPTAAHWVTVNAFTTINATVTPASQYVSWSDVPASTAITFGDCYRGQYTFGGSAGVAINAGLHMIAK